MSLHNFADLYTKSADAVRNFQVLEYPSSRRKFIELFFKITKENGILILGILHARSFLK